MILEALLAAMVYATPLAPADEHSLAQAYADSRLVLDKHSDGFFLDGTPEGQDALVRRWELGGEWAAAMLTAHPGVSPDEAATIALNTADDLTLLPLGGDSWLLGMGRTEGAFGAFAILKKIDGTYRVGWTAWRDGAADAHHPRLQAWSAQGARADCRSTHEDGDGMECGPLYSTLTLLPPDANGDARFIVDASYVEWGGSTVGAQLSIWNWDGTTATPLVFEPYDYMLDQGAGTRFDGTRLKVREKEDFKTFFACGACPGRQVDHVYDIAPDGVHDLGRLSVTPELDTIDAALDRLHRGLPVDALASPKAARVMESILRDTSEPGDNPSDFSLGMLMSEAIRHGKTDTELCFAADRTETYVFSLEKRGARFFIAAIRHAPSGCKGFPKSM